MAAADDNGKSEIPAWIATYYRQAYDSHKQLMRVVQISREGIGALTALPRLSKAVARVSGQEDDADALRNIETNAALAESEVVSDFPVLHSLATVGLWSWLEHLVKGLVIEWLVHDRKALHAPAFQRIKVKVGDFQPLNRREKAAFLLDMLEQDTASGLKRGVNRFESLLEPLGLDGRASETTAKWIFELQQVRNSIAHQNGKCDRRLKASCPWLKLKIGQPLTISKHQLQSYSSATVDYALGILYRIGDRHGVELRVSDGGA